VDVEISQQTLDDIQNLADKRVDLSVVERRSATASFYKVICGLCTIIGILTGFLLSDLRFMGQITETKTRVESLQKQVDGIEETTLIRFAELKKQADDHYVANHELIQRLYDMHVKQ
jgi:hypothetical protein